MFTTCEHEVCSNDVSRGVKSEPWERRTTIRVIPDDDDAQESETKLEGATGTDT